MKESANSVNLETAFVTDRGLNERRPLNEDSFLADDARHIFAVADGVGGAEAGEVASKTAIEVLDEAFRHQIDGADIEDLMELAIQRANASIHQMAHDHAKLTNMATTIVALHVAGNIATIGHVGDSRLYRLAPDGTLMRETEDHSIVEEEVRAGRMTPEQAAHHPSKNVISRALGAEETVEVDLKTIEVDAGTSFLLCSDGITRHIPDNEIRALLVRDSDLAAVCAELKRRCYDRGAEDNLTAVIVRVGEPVNMENAAFEETIEYQPEAHDVPQPRADRPSAGSLDATEDALVPPSRIAFPAPSASQTVPANPISNQHAALTGAPINIPQKRSSGATRLFFFLLFVVCAAGAFYAGARYWNRLPPALASALHIPPIPAVSQPTPIPEDPILKFERARRAVDTAPTEWLRTEVPKVTATNPIDATDPEFLYLYGRASLLTGNTEEAARAFE